MLDDKVILRTLDLSKESLEKFSDFVYDENKIVKELYSDDVVASVKPKRNEMNVASFNASRFNVLRAELELEGEDVVTLREDKSIHEVDGRPALTSIPKYIEEVGENDNEVVDKKDNEIEFER